MKGWISWSELIIVLIIGAVIYYGYLIVVYFKRRLKIKNNYQQPIHWRREDAQEALKAKDNNNINSVSPINSSVHELMNELNQAFTVAVRDQLNKEQIIEAIQNKLIKYPSVAASVFRDAIHQHIISEASLQLNIVLEPAEINSLW